MYNKGLHEILITRLWDILPPAYHAYKEQITANLSARIPLVMEPEKIQRQCFYKVAADGSMTLKENVYVGDPDYIKWRHELSAEDQIVNVVFINGPITRGGGLCSYGSKDIRDMLMQAADTEQVIGHVICIDSPGGSSMAKYDFEQAIQYIHDKGQKVFAFIDGQACSAGYAVAAMCDKIYFMHPSNDVGCIGTMCAFSISRSGDENAITKEHGVVFLLGIGGKLKSGKPHDGRAPDYDDWQLNGDILFYNEVLGHALEISSMGIRVDAESLDRQLTERGCDNRRTLPFHSKLLAGELPLTIGGGIGQSRLCMLMMGCCHIGEVQASVWDHETVEACQKAGIRLL